MAEQFYTILTDIGKAKIANSTAQGTKLNLTTFKVGDGGGSYYNPTENQKELKNVVWEGNLSSVKVDEENPNWIVLQSIIQAEHGGFIIREAGVYDDTGELIAIGKYPETYKPLVTEGSSKDLIIKMVLEVSNTSSVTLKVDDTIVLATKKELEILSLEIDAVQANINNMKIGVRNLVWNTDFDNIWSNVNNLATSLVKTDEGQKLTWLLEKKESAAAEILTSKLKGGKEYTLSFEARGNLATLITYILREKGATNNFYVFGGTGLLNTTSFTRITRTFKYVEGNKPSEKLFLGGTSTLANEWLEIKKDSVILVEGNKAPEDWIPTPEDMKYDHVGVRNLLSNGDFTKGPKGWGQGTLGNIFRVVTPTSTDESKRYLEFSKTNISNVTGRWGLINKGDLVTVSFRARQVGTGTINSSFYITDSVTANPISDKIPYTLTGMWKQYNFTFVAKTDGDNTHGIYFYGSSDDNLLINLTDIKVELSSHRTDYIPSTEDINEVIALKESGGAIGTVDIKNVDINTDSVGTSKNLMVIETGSDKITLDSPNKTLRPKDTTGILNLGTLNNTWNIIYGKNLNLNGTLTTDTANAGIDYLKTTKNILCLSGKVGSVVIDDPCFRPLGSLAGVYNLGETTYPWNIIYGNILKLGGTLELKSLSSTVDEVKTSKGYLNLLADGAGITIDKANNVVRPNSGYDGVMNLGSIDFRFKDIFLSGARNLSNGYTKLPNGFILQWGIQVTSANVQNALVTFPVAFTEDVFCIVATNFNTEVATYQYDVNYATSHYTLTSFKVWPRRASVTTAADFTTNCRWIAIGK